MTDLLEIIKNISSILAVVGIFVEIVPVKFNPISSLLKWIGKNLNGDLINRVEKLEEKVDENEKGRIRHEIYTFANNLRNSKREYTADEFQHIFEINEKYKNLGGNGQIKVEMKYIQEKYFELGGR
jgi:hypothetical protein|nr:MAG TPA: hypothetical protein [Caudoviricetes sp.]